MGNEALKMEEMGEEFLLMSKLTDCSWLSVPSTCSFVYWFLLSAVGFLSTPYSFLFTEVTSYYYVFVLCELVWQDFILATNLRLRRFQMLSVQRSIAFCIFLCPFIVWNIGWPDVKSYLPSCLPSVLANKHTKYQTLNFQTSFPFLYIAYNLYQS